MYYIFFIVNIFSRNASSLFPLVRTLDDLLKARTRIQREARAGARGLTLSSGYPAGLGIRLQEAGYLPFLLECHLQPSGFLVTCRREAEERGGTATGDEGVLREERDRAGPEAGAEEQRSSSGLAAERVQRATQAAEKMREHADLFDATDVAVAAATCSDDATLLLGIVPRTGQA